MESILESLKFGITPAILVVVYLLIVRIIDSRKESKQTKLNNDIINTFTKLNNFLDYITKDIINDNEEKKNYAIKTSFKSLANSIIRNSTTIIINNNININKHIITENINSFVEYAYYDLVNNLFLYRVDKYINQDWKVELIDTVNEIIFNDNYDKEKKLYYINTNINIKANNYINAVVKSVNNG